MNTVVITRNQSTDKETSGTLMAYRNGEVFTCKTLELPWKGNAHKISCIPQGSYEVKYTFWPAKLRSNYLLQNVPGRSGIFMHPGNYAFRKNGKPDIEGCILLGSNYTDLNGDTVLDIANTKYTVAAFQNFLHNEPFELVIRGV